jgi:hypothetical protein
MPLISDRAPRVFSRSPIHSVLLLLCAALSAQTAVYPQQKSTPAKIEKQFIVFPESVVLEQWPHTLALVNPPQNLHLLNPGECIRIGIFATGDNRDDFLAKTQLGFRIEFVGKTQEQPVGPLSAAKQIKPEGGDMVTAALAAANIKNPMLTMASLAASGTNWCVPADAQDGIATIDAEIESPAGHQKAHAKIQVESFETGSKHAFKDENELNSFLMVYHYQPNPARLFALLQYLAANEKWRSQTGTIETTATVFGVVLKENPAAAKDFTARISNQSGFMRAFGTLALLQGGYDIGPLLTTMSEDGRRKFANHPALPDPYDFTHVEDIGTRLDMLWSVFMANGELAPVQKVASALEWQPDWKAFDEARKSSSPPKEWTPEIGRAVGYGAAGWALGSFQRSDLLVADYIEFLIASPDTPDAVKAELKGLQTNPSFKYPDKK